MPATTETLSLIATTVPGATGVFRKYKLDFCCGGAVSLAEAAAAKGLDADAIAGELAALAPSTVEAPSDPTALIPHILSRYHDVHRRELPELIRLAKRVEAVHGERPDAPKGLAHLLVPFAHELDDHMRKEETVLFPMMLDGGRDFIRHPIGAMRAEHIEAGATLKLLEQFAIEPPADACPTWRALNAGLAKFCDDLMNHIHLENNVLFPAFETASHHEGCGCGH